jgi:hypothetical protein
LIDPAAGAFIVVTDRRAGSRQLTLFRTTRT